MLQRHITPSSKKRSAKWVCQCSCGKVWPVAGTSLTAGTSQKCKGCQRVQLTGRKFGRLLVLAPASGDHRKSTKAYWLCVCDCGAEITTRTDYLRTGRSTSCGCFRDSPRIDNNGAAWNQAISHMMNNAADRGIEWGLTSETAQCILGSNCHYCGTAPTQVRRTKQSSVTVNGIDRLDSSLGYIEGNVAPCCKHCNFAKNTMGVEQFREWIVRAYRHFASGRIMKPIPQAA